MNCAGLEGQIKGGGGGGEFATRVMEDAINNESREKKLEIGRSAAASRRPSTDHHRRGRPQRASSAPEILHECRLQSGVQQYEDTSRSRGEVVQAFTMAGGGLFIIISIDGYS